VPFRGWGHSWPGHFLPTDRVGHWSLRGAVDGPDGADFNTVAPQLKEARPRARDCAAAAGCPAPLLTVCMAAQGRPPLVTTSLSAAAWQATHLIRVVTLRQNLQVQAAQQGAHGAWLPRKIVL